MSSSDGSDSESDVEHIEQFFPKEEWAEMSRYEKRSFSSAARNYRAMISAGLEPKKPFFMRRDLKSQQSNSSSSPYKQHQSSNAEEQKQSKYTPDIVPVTQCKQGDENKENDDVLYCDECQQDWIGDCPKHGPLNVVEDTKVSAGEAGADRAAATLPQGLFLVPAIKREDGAEDADELGDGVWATSFLPQRTRFGPHEGPVIAWGAKEPAPSSNWMCFVRTLPCGWAAARANLRPFEYRNRIYFRTTRDVPVGEELIVRELQKHQSSADKNVCEHCGDRFGRALVLAQHKCAVGQQRDQGRRRVDRPTKHQDQERQLRQRRHQQQRQREELEMEQKRRLERRLQEQQQRQRRHQKRSKQQRLQQRLQGQLRQQRRQDQRSTKQLRLRRQDQRSKHQQRRQQRRQEQQQLHRQQDQCTKQRRQGQRPKLQQWRRARLKPSGEHNGFLKQPCSGASKPPPAYKCTECWTKFGDGGDLLRHLQHHIDDRR